MSRKELLRSCRDPVEVRGSMSKLFQGALRTACEDVTYQVARSDSSRPAPRWDGLSVIEQGLLTRAAAEGVLYEVCPAGDQRSPRRSVRDLDAILTALWSLLSDDLIGVYRVADGYPDLNWTELDEALRACRSEGQDGPVVGMYLTPEGEDLLSTGLTGLVTDLRFESGGRRSE